MVEEQYVMFGSLSRREIEFYDIAYAFGEWTSRNRETADAAIIDYIMNPAAAPAVHESVWYLATYYGKFLEPMGTTPPPPVGSTPPVISPVMLYSYKSVRSAAQWQGLTDDNVIDIKALCTGEDPLDVLGEDETDEADGIHVAANTLRAEKKLSAIEASMFHGCEPVALLESECLKPDGRSKYEKHWRKIRDHYRLDEQGEPLAGKEEPIEQPGENRRPDRTLIIPEPTGGAKKPISESKVQKEPNWSRVYSKKEAAAKIRISVETITARLKESPQSAYEISREMWRFDKNHPLFMGLESDK